MEQAPVSAAENRLAREKSPYLLQHARDPVDWYPWGEEAFEAARRLRRPIFLSIGYSTCHWCHVMARESFRNPSIAAVLNRDFIPVKVDREERPDVDALYLAYVTAATGSGGWPMSVFLTPDLVPILGATYMPPKRFSEVLSDIAATWTPDRLRVLRIAEKARASLETASASGPVRAAGAEPLEALVREGLTSAATEWDRECGGFGGPPKFPRPALLDFLLRAAQRPGGASSAEMALGTLRAMAAGGVRDHLGGGFHRYAVDARWRLPHFEKMLYDQAQLASAYVEAYQFSGDEEFASVAREVLDYVRFDLTNGEGAFWSAEDADSPDPGRQNERREGAFYIWTRGELEVALGREDAEFAAAAWGADWAGNVGDADPVNEFRGENVLRTASTPGELAKNFGGTAVQAAERLARLRQALLLARLNRPRPGLDDKVVCAWNGLMISAFATGAVPLADPAYIEVARRAADFVLRNLRRPGDRPLLRRWRDGEGAVPAFLDDYAFLIRGLLDLYEADGGVRWLESALELQEAQDRLFWDRDGAGYFFTDGFDSSLIARRKEVVDNAEPAGNSVGALNLIRLARMTERPEFAGRAEELLRWSASTMTGSAYARPLMLSAFLLALSRRKDIVLAARGWTPDLAELRRVVLGRFRPHQVVLTAPGGSDQRSLARIAPWTKDLSPPDGRAVAFVCANGTCARPVSEPSEVVALLDA